ncbi:MAG TPA: DUF5711 family protein [Clostridia bacterium]
MSLPVNSLRPDKPGKIANFILFVFLMLLILGISLFVYLKSMNVDIRTVSFKEICDLIFMNNSIITPEKSIGKIDLDVKEANSVITYGDLLVKCTSDILKAFNEKGEELWSHQLSIGNPRMKTSGKDLLVYDLGGKQIYILNGKEMKWSKTLDASILYADINIKGNVSVVHEVEGYKGGVTVYDPDGGEMFTRAIANNFPVCAKVSPDGKFIAINTVDTSGVKAASSIEFTDSLGKPCAAARNIKADKLFPGMWFLKNGVLAVSDTDLVFVDEKGNEKWKKDFTDRRLESSKIVSGDQVVAAISKGGSAGAQTTDMKIFDSEGKEIHSFGVDKKVWAVNTCENMISINTGRDAFFYNVKGKLKGKFSTKTDITDILFFNSREAAVVTKSDINVVKTGE